MRKTPPPHRRWNYAEKAEYWALIWGSVVMIITGAMLIFTEHGAATLPKVWHDVAQVIHFYEALLATLAILVWHFYWMIFDPKEYPMNPSWLIGKKAAERPEDAEPNPGRRLSRRLRRRRRRRRTRKGPARMMKRSSDSALVTNRCGTAVPQARDCCSHRRGACATVFRRSASLVIAGILTALACLPAAAATEAAAPPAATAAATPTAATAPSAAERTSPRTRSSAGRATTRRRRSGWRRRTRGR